MRERVRVSAGLGRWPEVQAVAMAGTNAWTTESECSVNIRPVGLEPGQEESREMGGLR